MAGRAGSHRQPHHFPDPWPLVARQIVHDDDVCGPEARHENFLAIGLEGVRWMGLSSTKAVLKPLIRGLATKVAVFQCPGRTPPLSLSPRRHRPRRRAILVGAQASSMTTNFSGSRSRWPSKQACRCSIISGPSYSSAWAVFPARDELPHLFDCLVCPRP